MSIEFDSSVYGSKLLWFIENRKIPLEWFRQPDIINYAAANMRIFDERVQELKQINEQLAFKENDGRFSVLAKLSGGLGVGSVGRVKWVEVDETCPDETPLSMTGLHSAGFFYPNLGDAVRTLGWRGIPYVVEPSEHHHSVIVPYDDENNFRLNNIPIDQLIKIDIEAGETIQLQ